MQSRSQSDIDVGSRSGVLPGRPATVEPGLSVGDFARPRRKAGLEPVDTSPKRRMHLLGADRKPVRPKSRQTQEAPTDEKVVVYRCPDGAEWHGRGRRPQVLVNALRGRASLEDFAAWRTARKAKKWR